MSIDPDLTILREAIGNGPPEKLETAAAFGGMAVMGLVILALIYDFNQPRHVAASFDILVFIIAPIVGFIIGGVAVHLLYYGTKAVLFLITYFWWAFVLGTIVLYYFEQH